MNILKDIGSGALQVLRTVAPTIADAAAGPFAPLVDPIVRKVLGSSDTSGTQTTLLSATPDQLLALKKADQDFQIQLQQLGISRDKLAYDDTASARAMQVATKDKTPAHLAWLIVAGFLGMVFFEAIAMIAFPTQWNALPRDAAALLGMAFGYLANEAKQVGAFYFGSSADSQAKTQTLSEIAKS